MNFCPNCGMKNEDPAALFCANCGYKFPRPQAADETPVKPQPRREEQPQKPVTTLFAEEPENRPKKPEKMEEDIFIIPRAAGARINPHRETPAATPQPGRNTSLFEEEATERGADLFAEEQTPPVYAEQGTLYRGEDAAPSAKQNRPVFVEDTIITPSLRNRPAQQPEENTAPVRAQQDARRQQQEAISSRVAAIEQQINAQEAERPRRPISRPQSQNLQELYEAQYDREEEEPVRRAVPAGQPQREERRQQQPVARRQPEERRDYPPEPPRRPRPQQEPEEAPRKKGFVKWIVLGVVLLALVVGGFFGVRALTGDPQKTIDAFVTAVQAKDIETLKKITALNNVTNADDTNWTALCNGLAEPEQMQKLQAQLKAQIDAPRMIGPDFPAVRLTTKTNLLIFKDYTITLTGVAVAVPKATAGVVLRLDEKDYQGGPSGEGQSYAGVMPGRYTAQLVGTNGATTESMQMDIYTNVEWDIQPPEGSGDATSEAPASEAPAETAPTTTSTAESKAAAKTLSESEINALIGDFYSSYIDCINQQKVDSLRRSTQTMRSSVSERIKRPGNQQNTFEYVSASCTASTIKTGEEGGVPTITFTGTFKYKYTPREGAKTTEADQNVQTVQLVYNNGEWQVNKMANA